MPPAQQQSNHNNNKTPRATHPPVRAAPPAPPQAPPQQQAAPLAPAVAYYDGAFDVVVDGTARRLRLRARDGAEVVELGVVARADRRLLVAVHAGRTYVGIAPDVPPALVDDATGAVIALGGLALADALLCLVDGGGLRPHAAWVTGVGALAPGPHGEAELWLRVVVRHPVLRMAAQCERAGDACLVQTLRLHAL